MKRFTQTLLMMLATLALVSTTALANPGATATRVLSSAEKYASLLRMMETSSVVSRGELTVLKAAENATAAERRTAIANLAKENPAFRTALSQAGRQMSQSVELDTIMANLATAIGASGATDAVTSTNYAKDAMANLANGGGTCDGNSGFDSMLNQVRSSNPGLAADGQRAINFLQSVKLPSGAPVLGSIGCAAVKPELAAPFVNILVAASELAGGQTSMTAAQYKELIWNAYQKVNPERAKRYGRDAAETLIRNCSLGSASVANGI